MTSGLLARYPVDRQVDRVMFRAVVIFGVATAPFGLSASLPISLLALAVLGASDVVSVVIRVSLRAAATGPARLTLRPRGS